MCESVCVYVPVFLQFLLDLLPIEHRHKSPQQEINTNHPTNISLQWQKSKGRSNTTLEPGKRRPQVEQVRKIKKTEKMKEQGRNS